MRFCVMTEPQEGATYSQLLAMAKRAEELGFEAFFRSDHYTSLKGPEVGSTDAWATLAGLARDTKTIRLGTLMSPVTWRHPVVLAKTVATVDEMSGGRIELGIGTGWQPDEHARYGFRFESFGARFDWLEDSLEIITRLWSEESTTYVGKRFSVRDAHLVPKPVQKPHPPILIGGTGLKKTPRLTAKYAQEFNTMLADPETFRSRRELVEKACEAEDRDPSSITYSLMSGVLAGSDQSDLEARAGRMVKRLTGGSDGNAFLKQVKKQWIVGTPSEAAGRLADYAQAGCERVMCQLLDLDDLDHLDVIAKELKSALDG